MSQCRTWISKNVPHASLHEVASTATAAELAQREPGAAAIASKQAAVRYGLRVLFTDIEDRLRDPIFSFSPLSRTSSTSSSLSSRRVSNFDLSLEALSNLV